MTQQIPEDINVANEQSLRKLSWAIEASQGEFALMFARCNYAQSRTKLVKRLRAICPVHIQEIRLQASAKTLFTSIRDELGSKQPEALMVFGLESVKDLTQVLISANKVREEFRKTFKFPLILWVNDKILKQLFRIAPDFESWATTTEFFISSNDLITLLQKATDQFFKAILDIGVGQVLGEPVLGYEISSLHRDELEAIQQDLEGVEIDQELLAELEFLLGQVVSHSMETTWRHYERSLQLWPKSYNLIHHAALLFHMGLWWRKYAVLHRDKYEEACLEAKGYLQKSLEILRQNEQPALEAKFMNALGEVLQRLEQWDEVEALAQRALNLHQTYSEPTRLAHDYGLLADAALSKPNWEKAKQYSEQALRILTEAEKATLEGEVSLEHQRREAAWKYQQGFYCLSLARALDGLGQKEEAIQTLESARRNANPRYDPHLYIRILRELRNLYFESGEYLNAFDIKQERQSVEQQYGFRAFVGAGRLQPRQRVSNPILTDREENQASTLEEIAASGRSQDIKRLTERIKRKDCKLTVIHGQSGVGKSSLLQAGLVPALSSTTVGTRDTLIVVHQVYTNWIPSLGQNLSASLAAIESIATPPTPESLPEIIQQLRDNADHRLVTILVFDQFEEFFFIYKDITQRKAFYDFLQTCLNIPYVIVILSLREDYLHYLLEGNRLENLEAINSNILDKNILYYLGNFCPEDAKSVIQSLTCQTQFYLEEALIDELVRELSQELSEVRPIELQVVGAQLQSENITTLTTYKEQGPKEALVGRFLEEVIKDCGPDNDQIAKLVLYLLTDENNTRPLKTRADLELELDVPPDKLDLVLDILVKSRLVFLVPASPSDRYQLVHDYLVAFVRQQQSARLIAEIEKEREQRKLTEARLNKVLKKQLQTARRATLTLASLLVAIAGFSIMTTLVFINTQLNAQILASEDNSQLDRVVSALRIAKRLKRLPGVIPEVSLGVLSELNQAVYKSTEKNRLEGHTDTINHIKFSPNDQLLASASDDKTVKIWGIDGALVTTLIGHTDKVNAVIFSPNGEFLASASDDKTVKIWEIDGALVTTLAGHTDKVNAVNFSADGKLLASASDDKTVKIWGIDSDLKRTLEGHTDRVISVSFSPDGRSVASSGEYDVVKLWRLDSEQVDDIESLEINERSFGINDIRFSTDGKKLTLLGAYGGANLWDVNGNLLKTINFRNYHSLHTSLTHDNQLLASVSKLGNRSRIEINTPRTDTYWHPGISLKDNATVTELAFSKSNGLLASANTKNIIKLWEIDNEISGNEVYDYEPIKTFKVNLLAKKNIMIFDGLDNAINLLTSNRNLITKLGESPSVFAFNPSSTNLLVKGRRSHASVLTTTRQVPLQLDRDETNGDTLVRVSPDGNLILLAKENNKLELWRSNGEFVAEIPDVKFLSGMIIFSPDSKKIAVGTKDNNIMILDKYGEYIITPYGHTTKVKKLAFSPDSRYILSIGDDNLAHLWSITGKHVKALHHNSPVVSAKFSLNGQIIASWGSRRNEIKVWNRNGTLISNIETFMHNIRWYDDHVAISPNGEIIAFATPNGTINLWDMNGNPIPSLKGHLDSVNSIEFNPDGQLLVSAGQDNTVRLWDIEKGLIDVFQGHRNSVRAVKFSPNGKVIASASYYGTVHLWKKDGSVIKVFDKTTNQDPSGDSYIYLVGFSSDSNKFAFVDVNWKQFQLNIFDLKSGELQSIPTVKGSSFDLSSDHKVIVYSIKDSFLKEISLEGSLLNSLENSVGGASIINSFSISSDGEVIVAANNDGTLTIWDESGHLVSTIQAHEHEVNDVSIRPDRQMIASASSDKTVKIWDGKGQPIKTLPEHNGQVIAVSFSPDNKLLASLSSDNASPDKTIRLWKTSTFEELGVIDGVSGNNLTDSLSFGPDGNWLVVGDGSKNLELFLRKDAWGQGFWIDNAKLNPINSLPDIDFLNKAQTRRVSSKNGMYIMAFDLDSTIAQACEWVGDYLKNNPSVEESDRKLCDGVGNNQ